MIKIGQEVSFDVFDGIQFQGTHFSREGTIGTVVYVNEDHRWFSVEHGPRKRRISFNFVDIGSRVCVVGGDK